jgi:hypothetical protein
MAQLTSSTDTGFVDPATQAADDEKKQQAAELARQKALQKKLDDEAAKSSAAISGDSTPGYTAPKVQGKSAYDIQREQVSSQAEADRVAREAALKRRVGAQNIAGSGIQESAERQIQQQVGSELGQGLSAVNAQEAAAAQAAQTAATQQEYTLAQQTQAQQAQAGLQTQALGSQAALQAQQLAAQQELQKAQLASTEKLASSQIASNEKIAADSQLIQKQGLTLEQAQSQGYTDASGKHVMGSQELAVQGLTLQQAALQGYTDASGKHVMGSAETAQMSAQTQAQQVANTLSLGQQQIGIQEKQLAQAASEFKIQQDYNTWVVQKGLDQHLADQVWQTQQNNQSQGMQMALAQMQIMSAEKISMNQLSIQQQQLAQQASQFADQLSFNKWVQQQGMNQHDADLAWQAHQNQLQMAQTKQLTYAQLTNQQQMLAQQLAQNATQFADQQSFNRWAAQQGFSQHDSDMAWQAEQNALQRQSTEKLSMADLTLRQQQLAQSASQFTDQLSFQKWAINQGNSEQDVQRAWQASQNQAQLAQTKELTLNQLSIQQQQIYNQASQFKDQLSFNKMVQQQGLDQHSADMALQAYQNDAARQSTEKISMAQLNMQEQQLAQQASQFSDQLSFNKWATQSGLDQQSAARSWQSYQNSLDRQQKGDLTMADLNQKESQFQQQLATQNIQFNTEEEYKKYALNAGLTDAEAARTFQAQQNQNNLDQQLKLAGGFKDETTGNWIPGTQQLAAQGLTLEQAKVQGYTPVDSNGKPILDASGQPVHIKGSAEIAADANVIAQQGLSIQDAQLHGYTDANGKHVMGSLEINAAQIQAQKDISKAQIASNEKISTGRLALDQTIADRNYDIANQGLNNDYVKLHGMDTVDSNGNSIHIAGQLEIASQGLTMAQAQMYGYKDPVTGVHIPGTLETQAAQTTDLTTGKNIQVEIEQMREESSKGLANLQNTFEKQKALDSMVSSQYFSQGTAAKSDPTKKLTDAQLASMKQQFIVQPATLGNTVDPATGANVPVPNPDADKQVVNPNYNPLAAAAYEAGAAGRSYTDWQAQVEANREYMNLQIMQISEDPDFANKAKPFINEFIRQLQNPNTNKNSIGGGLPTSSLNSGSPVTTPTTTTTQGQGQRNW